MSLKYQLKQFVFLYQSPKSNFYDDFFSKICSFEIFWEKTWKKRCLTRAFPVEWRSIQWTFWCFLSYFDPKNWIDPRDTPFFLKSKSCVEMLKTGLKLQKHGIFQHFLAVSRLGSIDWIFFSLLEPLGTIFGLLGFKKIEFFKLWNFSYFSPFLR